MQLPGSPRWQKDSPFSQDVRRITWDTTKLYTNLIPSAPYRQQHHHIFMNAMQPWSEWIYHGDMVPEEPENFFSAGPCLRTDGWLQEVGKSPKRLLLFQMLGYEGLSHPSDLEKHIAHIHTKIGHTLQQRVSLRCRIHPDSQSTLGSILTNLGISFEYSCDCLFREPQKTDRTWYRIEFVTNTDTPVELFNFVILTQIKNTELSRFILDGGGSLERMLMFSEWVTSGDQTSIFPLAWTIYGKDTSSETVTTKRRVINLIRWIAYLKINNISLWSQSERNSIQKTLATLYRMLFLAVYDLIGQVDQSEILQWFETEIQYLNGETQNLSELRQKLTDMESEKEKIIHALRQFWPSALQKVANRYSGWDLLLSSLIVKKESF